MESRAVLILAFLALIISSNGVDQGKEESMEENEELERQLKILNKPRIKTITTEHGDIYDCVDIYKQPAFDHPLLKNHKLQMRPSFMPFKKEKLEDVSTVQPTIAGLPDGGCPQGYVPIRRTQKDDLVKAKKFLKNSLLINNSNHRPIGYAATLDWHGIEKLYGTRCGLNVWGLSVDLDRYSAASTWVKRGCECIAAGWMVNPAFYGDKLSRIFIAWTTDCGQRTGCFNTLCPGFVQIHNRVALGDASLPLSIYEGQQYEMDVDVFKDLSSDGNWWLVIAGNLSLGYWPAELFTKFSQYADSAKWGGYAYGYLDEAGPSMGSGFPPSLGFGKAAFVRGIQLMDMYREFYDPFPQDLSHGSVNPCYGAEAGYVKEWSSWSLYYGGPGCLRHHSYQWNSSNSLIAV